MRRSRREGDVGRVACPRCTREIELCVPGEAYCTHCGRKLKGPAAPAVEPPPPAEPRRGRVEQLALPL